MRIQLLSLLFIFISVGTQVSCKKTRPQLPSNKVEKDDIDRKTSLEITNRSLIHVEDSLLKKQVAELPGQYERSDLGFWYQMISQKKEGAKLSTDEECRISYQILLLDSTLVEEQKKISIRIGRKEVINGIDFALETLQKGDSVNLLIPWYLAYGTQGKNKLVPPYTSIFCRLKIEND